MTSTEIIQEVFVKVRHTMRYETDMKNYGLKEHWRSWASEIEEGIKGIKDDCDAYALTFAEMLVNRGIKKEHVAIGFCSLQGGGHLVCLVFDEAKGEWIVLDNNVINPARKDSLKDYEWISCMYLNNPGPNNWVKLT